MTRTGGKGLHVGDCPAIMREWPDKCVDLVFCSPPYEAARTYGIDFKLTGQEYVDWCVERYVECVRVCRGLVAWVIEGQTRQFRYSAAPILLMADLHRRGIHLRKPPALKRVGIPGSGGPDWLRNDYEFIVCAGPGGKFAWSDNTACGHPPKWAPGGEMAHRLTNGTRVNQWGPVGGPRGGGGRKPSGEAKPSKMRVATGGAPYPSHRVTMANGREVDRTRLNTEPDGTQREQGYTVPVLANPGNVIECIVGGGVMGDALCHDNEAPFPESLATFFVKSFCPPGGIVLDPFSGSGTTVKVAATNGRKWIGIDIRESQIELSRQRLGLFAAAPCGKE